VQLGAEPVCQSLGGIQGVLGKFRAVEGHEHGGVPHGDRGSDDELRW
jgi:hypothetical protein